jgi:hypothetical protein
MKTRSILLNGLYVLVVTSLLTFTSCNKDEDESKPITDEEVDIAQDDALADAMFEKSFENVDDQLSTLDYKSLKSYTATSDSISVVVTKIDSITRQIVIDYGAGYVNRRKDTLKGKITITKKHGYLEDGAERTVVLDDLSINNVDFEGTRKVVCDGYDVDNQNIVWDIELTGGKIIINNSITITRETTKTRTRYFGSSIWDWSDDYVEISGVVTGVNAFGESYTRTWKNVNRQLTCLFFTSGTITAQAGDREPIVLNYGSGGCDEYATVSRGDQSKEIDLGLLWWRRVARRNR